MAAAQRRRSSQFIMSKLPGAKHAAGQRPPEQPQRGRPLLAGGQLTQQQQQQQPNMAPWKVDINDLGETDASVGKVWEFLH